MPYRIVLVALLFFSSAVMAQDYRWQQRADYLIDVKLDVANNLLTGSEKIIYTNNSRDTLRKVFFHLYYNAFQPGSMMDVRSRNISDPDKRIADRISKLQPNEVGYQHIDVMKQDGKAANFRIDGTIMEVTLAKPVVPNSKTTFDVTFTAQVPIQIRRTGRNNREGISYSMTQWYPKLAEYDHQGWHAYQYIGREFQGVWGDYDVKITIDPTYVIAGTGKLQNPDKIGYGYEKAGTSVARSQDEAIWNFKAKDVIDFAWAADPDYRHDILKVANGPDLHFFYQPKNEANWKKMEPFAVRHFEFMNNTFGKYPYETYSIIQGGDGGMEYPMCTLILGDGNLDGLVGVMAHEAAHSWYQGVLASNEALYPWLDEGFTDFASQEFEAKIANEKPTHSSSYNAYFGLVKSGLQEPASQASDHYNTSRAYSVASYSMGTVFLHQLKYIIGEENFYKGMRRYYDAWKFRHPEPNDFIRVMEKVSGLQLKWYMSYWINTTKRIDYGIKNVLSKEGKTFVTLERIGDFPMPVDLVVTLNDGSKHLYYIPVDLILGNKPNEDTSVQRTDLQTWPWVNPSYVLSLPFSPDDIANIEIDPSLRMADIERKNNRIDLKDVKVMEKKEY